MPAASTSRQPENPLAWFDGAEGKAVLTDEIGLLMPLLVRCPGHRVCHVLPTERAAANAQPTLMSVETRMWCDQAGWHGEFGTQVEGPPHALQGMDLIIAAHVLATFPGGRERAQVIHHLLAAGGTAFFIEFYPWSLYRCRWKGAGLETMPLRRMRSLLHAVGFETVSTYALRPRSSLDSTGMLLRHNWRLPSWLPLRAYVVRVRKRETGANLIGTPAPILPVGVPN